ncbi:MAG: hypothetical protein IKH61_00685 [Bacteroidales bacterium]|nr:hypothetical protein [Bacteroidales bacterium]
MLEGTRQEISYFQRFYDGSTEDTKFTSHRDSNGNVTYSFLKYNLSSGKSRTGSFFGMSLAFSGVYCNHPLRLYELFEYVYQNHVLCNASDADKGILKSIADSDVKAQYLITRFEDRREHIKFIEKVFLHNLATNDVLATAFYPLDPSFKNENQNLVVKLPLVDGLMDETIIGRFRDYSYVTISPDWKPVETGTSPKVEIAPQTVLQWKELIPNYQRYIIQGLGSLAYVDKDEITKYQKQTKGILGQLRKYSYNKNNVPSLETDYEELSNQLAELYQKAVDVQSGGGGETHPYTPSPTPLPTPSLWDKVKEWVDENKVKVAGIVGAAVVLAVLLVLILPKLKSDNPEPNPVPQYCCTEDVDKGINEALDADNFMKAYESVDSIVSDITFKEARKQYIDGKLEQYHNCLGKEIDSLIEKKNWEKAVEKTNCYYNAEDKKSAKLGVLKAACLEYYDAKVKEINPDNYYNKAGPLKNELKTVVNLNLVGNEKYKEWKEEIDDNAKSTELVGTKYEVEFYETYSTYKQKGDTPIYTFKDKGDYSISVKDCYIYKIKENGKYLTGSKLKNAVKCTTDGLQGEFLNAKNDCIQLYLQTSSSGTLTIGPIKITVKKEE